MAIDINLSIYRFMSFESFFDIIQSKTLAFVHHSIWEDVYDSFILKLIKYTDGREEILKALKQITPEHENEILRDLEDIDRNLFGLSWTTCHEHPALWKMHKSDTSVRIETKFYNVLKLTQQVEHQSIFLFPLEIKYYENFTIKSQLEDTIVKDNKTNEYKIKIDQIVTTKRKYFEYEKEIRLLVFSLNDVPKNSKVIHIDFGHIKNFICSVMLNPEAPNWFVDSVSSFCKDNGLNFFSSTMYTFSPSGPQQST